MHTYRHILFLLGLMSILLPGRGAELRLCLGGDGHLAVSLTAVHGCRATDEAPADCHDEADLGHGPCADLVLCPGDFHLPRGATTSGPALCAAPLTAPAPWLIGSFSPSANPLPSPDARPAVEDLRTVIIRR